MPNPKPGKTLNEVTAQLVFTMQIMLMCHDKKTLGYNQE